MVVFLHKNEKYPSKLERLCVTKFKISYISFFHEMEPFKRLRGQTFQNAKIRDTLEYNERFDLDLISFNNISFQIR